MKTTTPARRRLMKRTLALVTAVGMFAGIGGPVEPAWAELPVTSTEDITPPQASDLVISPLLVDVTDGRNKTFTATLNATDDLSGVRYITAYYSLQSGQTSRYIYFHFTRVTGDANNGTYSATATATPLTANGTYQFLSLSIQDTVGNSRTYSTSDNPGPASLTVKSNADAVPPVMTAVRVAPNPIDVSQHRQDATVEIDVTDDASGVNYVIGQFISPSTRQAAAFSATPVSSQPGLARGTAAVAQYSEAGDWRLNHLCAYDKAGNQQCFGDYTTPTVTEAFPAALSVMSDPEDRAKPDVTAFRVNPAGIDVTNSAQNVSVDFDVKDDISGVQYAYATFTSPRTAGASPEVMRRHAFVFAPSIYSRVLNADGTYTVVEDDSKRLLSGTLGGNVTFPQYDRSGDWAIEQVCVIDQVNWRNCYSASTTPSISTLGPTKLTVKWNRTPTVTVTGVTETTYLEGSEPTPACEVNDLEDGVVTGVEPTISRTGDIVTVTCTYTDEGIDGGLNKQTGTHTITYTVTKPSNTAPTVQVTGVLQTSYEMGSDPTPGCSVVDAEDTNESASAEVGALSGPLAAYGAGTRIVTCTYTDAGGLTGTHSVTYSVVDTGKPTLMGEPTTQPNAAGWYKTNVTIHWTASDTGVGIDPAAVPGDDLLTSDAGAQTRTASVTDRAGNAISATSSPAVNIDKTPPTAAVPTFSVNPKAISETSTISSVVSDNLSGVAGGEYFIDADPGEGSGMAMSLVGGRLEATLGSNLVPGVYTIGVRAVDVAGNWSTVASEYVVVYDPDGGFVTGGGRIDSPVGAYTADSTISGGASFGFVSKYKKGSAVPTGNTEFQFHAGNLNFSSSTYEWLVVSGPKAQYKGQGAINGQSGYTFLLTVTDGQVNGGGGVDKFRIKIWNAGGVVYDNGLGGPDDLSNGQALAGGSIVIHG